MQQHDLSVLGPLLRAGGAQAAAKGHAHYLLALNDFLRAVFIEVIRTIDRVKKGKSAESQP